MTQLALNIRSPRLRVPMTDVAGAYGILGGDNTEGEIIDLAEAGYLWAWNIGDRDATRTEWRFLASSLETLRSQHPDDLDHLLASNNPAVRYPAAWDQVLALVLPKHNKPFLTGREVKRSLNCRRQHFINLVSTGQLPGSDYRRGPGGSPSVDRKAFIHFLETRLVGGL